MATQTPQQIIYAIPTKPKRLASTEVSYVMLSVVTIVTKSKHLCDKILKTNINNKTKSTINSQLINKSKHKKRTKSMQKNFKKNDKRKVYQIFGILLLCFALVSIFSYSTVSWLMDQSTTSNGEPNIVLVGTLDLDVTTNFKFKNLALAPDTTYTTDQSGEDIATYIKTSTLHDIDGAYVRIRFTTTRKNVGDSSYIDNSDLLSLYFVGNLTTATTYSDSTKNKWFYNSSDNYYYYIGGIYSSNIMFNRGYKTSNTMQNIYADADVRLEFIVESIQRQYGASAEVWNTAPQIFKTMVTTESNNVSSS